MFEKLRNIFQVPKLRRRILFTLGLFVVYRLGEHMPTPGVNAAALAGAFRSQANTLFGLYDMFVGGAFSRATIFALGIMPYISASIILQLLGAVVPHFEKLRKEGEEGQKKITQYTRFGTVLISVVQSYAYSIFLVNLGASQGLSVVPNPGFAFYFSTIITQTAGTILVMWLGEKITEFGIGNGISLIIFVNILGGVPNRVMQSIDSVRAGSLGVVQIAVIVAIMVAVTAFVIVMTQATRKIPVQYAKRMVGRPGRHTAQYIDNVLSRITLPGAFFLAAVAVLPDIFIALFKVRAISFGGTSVLIVVGVALDTLQQVESHLLMRHYEGFVKRG